MSEDVLFRGVSGAGQRFVAGVDPGLRGLDGAGDQKDGVLARVVLPVDRYTTVWQKGRNNIYNNNNDDRKKVSFSCGPAL